MSVNKNFEQMLLNTFGESIKNQILDAYKLEPVRGLRSNRLKPFEMPFEGEPSPLNSDVFVPKNYAKTVTHPLSHAGCYYIQDPSATTPVVALKLEPNDCVIDLCAAPGGKSTYILNEIPNGFLISNDIDAKRNLRLVHNMDRWGHENVTVISASTEKIAKEWPNTFDKVLLDAPCSGEGLFRRDREFALTYKDNTALEFKTLQLSLIEDAYEVCKDGGIIVYSTCTLNRHENEEVIMTFLSNHPECFLEDPSLEGGLEGLDGLNLTRRFIPNDKGEGHFVARIRVVKESVESNHLKFKPFKVSEEVFDKLKLSGNFKKVNEFVYGLKNRGFLDTKLPITRDGVLVGSYRKSHFEFDHALSQSLSFKSELFHEEVDLETAYRYLFGHQIESTKRGIFCVNYLGHSLGFAKGNGSSANNKYPKGLRNKFLTY